MTYYFREKSELMLFALDRLCSAILRDLDAASAGAQGGDRIRRILETTLPIGPKESAGWRIWVAFIGLAAGNKRLREEHQRRLDFLSRRFTEEIEALQQAGLVSPTLDARFEADTLIALSDGLGLSYIGLLDELSIFNRALAPDEVAAVYRLQSGVSGLVR